VNAHRIGILQYGLLVASAIALLLFYQTRTHDVEQHDRRLDLLLQLKQTEAQLDRDVLQTASFLLVHYDPFVTATRRVEVLSKRLMAPELALSGDGAADFDEGIETYLASLLDKLDLIERLKSTAALVRNILHYLPVSADELMVRNPELGARLSHLFNALYRYNLLPSEMDRRRLAEYIDSFEDKVVVEASVRQDLEHVLFHIRSNLRLMSELAELRDRYTEIPSDAHFDALYGIYSDLHARHTRHAEHFSRLLLTISLALLVGMGIALRKIYIAQAQLRKLYRALEQSPATVVITDSAGLIEYVNPKFEETTGYTAAEAIGQNPRLLKSGDKSSAEYKELWDTITAGKVWRGQFHNKRKSGCRSLPSETRDSLPKSMLPSSRTLRVASKTKSRFGGKRTMTPSPTCPIARS